MRKSLALLLMLVALSFLLAADHIGELRVTNPFSQEGDQAKRPTLTMSEPFFLQALSAGQLVMNRQQVDTMLPGRTHERYQQYHQGLRIFGGQVVAEKGNGRLLNLSGQFYPIEKLDMTEVLTPEAAFRLLADDLKAPATATYDAAAHARVIYPREDGTYRLCHQVRVEMGPSQYETALIDVQDGQIYARNTNLKFETRIGIGVDYHGVNRKFPHTFEENAFYLWDDHEIRPVKLATYDFRNGGYVAQNAAEHWQNNGTNVSAHYNTGLVYDFLYLFLGRNGFDNNNHDMLVVTNRTEYRDNASWNGQSVNFYLTGNQNAQYAAALDIVAHECAHAVTQFSSDLVYSYQSGALNESFSDIIGSSVEQYWHPAGAGLFQADWYIGEDAFPSYSYGINNGFVRYMADPNRFSQFGNPNYPDPCHLSQYYDLPFSTDRGGVHVNMTIYSHAFYLLAVGGTNRVSKLSVSGLGLEKALRIFYRAWVYKLTENSNFQQAAQALLNSAVDLYGQGSNEYQQTVRAMQAIGWAVN
jgi:Zn-dependent metalloprotease